MFALIDETGRVCEFFAEDPRVPAPPPEIVIDDEGEEQDLTPVYIEWPLPQRIVDVSDIAEVGENWTMDEAGLFHPPAAPPALEPAQLLASLKAEAGLVIGSVVSTTSQLNLNAAMNVIGAKTNSARSTQEQAFAATFAEGHAWIQAVRARIPVLLQSGGATPQGETRWPEPSQAVRDLAAAY